jgi:hypothetical protein
MVRLVFRPYTQIRRSICTSEPLRASTRVSSGFALFRHSSPSFGSQQLCSYSRTGSTRTSLTFVARKGVAPNTRIDVRLLGPCFKTGGGAENHPTLPFQQFHTLFHSLFKVLFIFPSQYLFAIGLSPLFSLGWSIPPLGAAFPNNSTHPVAHARPRGSHPVPRPVPGDLDSASATATTPEGFQTWALAASLAATGAIPVGFFSSAY